MAITIRPVGTSAELDECYKLRVQVFVEEQGVPPWEELDADDETALHFMVEEEGVVVGTARLVVQDESTAKIGRVAINKKHRGEGLGRDLMWYVMAAGFKLRHKLILDAQVTVIPFYDNLGFDAEGEVFLDCGIEHQRMVCWRSRQK